MDGSEGPMAFDLGVYLAYGMSLYVLKHSTQAENNISYMGHGWLADFQPAFWIHGKWP
jgi:hypothetical protein